MMKLSSFQIGAMFVSASGTWQCTDIGTRTVIAIKISDHDDPLWFSGPPYAVSEVVFDEDDREGCWS